MPESSALLQARAVVASLPNANGRNWDFATLAERVDERSNYVKNANLTATYAIAIALGANTAMFAIPSQASSLIKSRIEPSFSSAGVVDVVNDARAVFATADIGLLGIANPALEIWETVERYSNLSLNTIAADTLLDYVVACLDNENFRNLDTLIGLMAEAVLPSEQNANQHALARVINVLGLTFCYAPKLTHRIALRSAYRNWVAEMEGPASADAAVAHL